MKKITRFFLIFSILVIMISCGTTKYIEVPIETVRTEYVYKEYKDSTNKRDSVYVHDSIYVKEKGDTVYYYKEATKYITNTEFKYINKTDTVIKTDSIDTPVYITKEVEVNKLYWWLKTLMYLGGALFSVCILLFGFKTYKLLKK